MRYCPRVRILVCPVRVVSILTLVIFVAGGATSAVHQVLRAEPKFVSVEGGIPERGDNGMGVRRPPSWTGRQVDATQVDDRVEAAVPGGTLKAGDVVAASIANWPGDVHVDLGSSSNFRLSWYAEFGEFRVHLLDGQGSIAATTTQPWSHPDSGTTVLFVVRPDVLEVWLNMQLVGKVPVAPFSELRVWGDLGRDVVVEVGSIS